MSGDPGVALGLLASKTEELASIFRSRLPAGWSLNEIPPQAIDDHVGMLDYLVTGGVPLRKSAIDAAGRLKAVHKLGVGYDEIDVAALQARGIPLAVCPIGSADAVAEHAVALAFAAVKNVANLDYAVRHRGSWPKWEARRSLSQLGGRTVGIVGYGRIGQVTARLFAGVGCEVIVFTRTPAADAPGIGFAASMAELFARASLVSVHVPSTPDTEGLIDRHLLEALGPGGILVNTSRGSVVNEDDLFDALRSGKLGFAALDVLREEPPDDGLGLASFPNLIVTPHVGGGGFDIFETKADFILDNLARFSQGGRLAGMVGHRGGVDLQHGAAP